MSVYGGGCRHRRCQLGDGDSEESILSHPALLKPEVTLVHLIVGVDDIAASKEANNGLWSEDLSFMVIPIHINPPCIVGFAGLLMPGARCHDELECFAGTVIIAYGIQVLFIDALTLLM